MAVLTGQCDQAGAGALVGGGSAGLVNPEDAGFGAWLAALFPALPAAAGEAGKMIGRATSGLKNTLGMTTGAGAETFGTAWGRQRRRHQLSGQHARQCA